MTLAQWKRHAGTITWRACLVCQCSALAQMAPLERAVAQAPPAMPNATPPPRPSRTLGMGRVSRGVLVLPESVTVGDPFRVILRVRAPRGAILEFPSAPDSGTKVEALDPVQVAPAGDTTMTEQTATYRLAAWDVGRLPIRLADVLIKEGDIVRRLPVGADLVVTSLSVLPADSSQRIPTPPRALFEFGYPWWWWAVVALAILALGGVLWWWWRQRRAPSQRVPSAYELAMAEFARIDAMELLASGERGHFVALVADVVRDYLERVVSPATTSLTTSELAPVLQSESRVPAGRLLRVLHDVDLVKFAAAAIDGDRAREIGTECRALVATVDDAMHAVPTPRRVAA